MLFRLRPCGTSNLSILLANNAFLSTFTFQSHHQDPIADRDEHGGNARIPQHRSIQILNGRRLLFRRRLFQHIPVPQDVIDQKHPLRRQQVERPPVIIHIIDFVGVDEDQIERSLEVLIVSSAGPMRTSIFLPTGDRAKYWRASAADSSSISQVSTVQSTGNASAKQSAL